MSKWTSVLAAVAVASCASVVSNDPIKLSLATATPGGGFPVFGDAFAAAIREADPTITLEPRNTRGSAENIPLLDESKVDLALVAGEPAHEALAGKGRAPAKMKAVVAMYPTAGFFLVRGDSAYRTVHDLKGKAIVWGAKGSGFVNQAGYMLEALGLDRDRDFQSIYLDRAGDGPAMLREGKVAALWGGGLGYPPFIEAAKSPAGARFIAPGEGEVKLILAKHPFLKPATIPAGSYLGQAEAIASVGSWSFVFARADLPDDAAYRVTRALHRGEANLAARLPQARETTAANTYRAASDPSMLHPGTLRYLREAGLAR
jgi:TRAP transporter TAXI family solute receptor